MELASFNCPICGILTTGTYLNDGSIKAVCQKCYEKSTENATKKSTIETNKVEIKK